MLIIVVPSTILCGCFCVALFYVQKLNIVKSLTKSIKVISFALFSVRIKRFASKFTQLTRSIVTFAAIRPRHNLQNNSLRLKLFPWATVELYRNDFTLLLNPTELYSVLNILFAR